MVGRRRPNGKVFRIDRNKKMGPLTEFNRIANPPGAEESGVLATFENNRYGVFLKQTVSHGFTVPGVDGAPQPMGMKRPTSRSSSTRTGETFQNRFKGMKRSQTNSARSAM